MSDEELTELWRKRAEVRRRTDFDDLNRERAGVQGSRINGEPVSEPEQEPERPQSPFSAPVPS